MRRAIIWALAGVRAIRFLGEKRHGPSCFAPSCHGNSRLGNAGPQGPLRLIDAPRSRRRREFNCMITRGPVYISGCQPVGFLALLHTHSMSGQAPRFRSFAEATNVGRVFARLRHCQSDAKCSFEPTTSSRALSPRASSTSILRLSIAFENPCFVVLQEWRFGHCRARIQALRLCWTARAT